MKKTLTNMGGLILFYIVIILSVLLLNLRFNYLENMDTNNLKNNYIAMNN